MYDTKKEAANNKLKNFSVISFFQNGGSWNHRFFIFGATKNYRMKKDTFFWLLIVSFSCFIWSCQNQTDNNSREENTNPDLISELPGTWEAVSIKVNMPSVYSTEIDSVFEVSEEYWVEKFSIKPVVTIFQADKKYIQRFRNSQDSLLNEVKGIWNVFGDTLMLIEPNSTNSYIVQLDKGLITFNSDVDWDGDGAQDDTYQGVHRKISSSY